MPILRLRAILFIPLVLVMLLSACAQPQTSSAEPTALPYTPNAPVEPVAQAPAATEGDPAAGAKVFGQYCAGCHSVEKAVELAGPSLFQAGMRLQPEFIKQSIQHPLDYINPAYQEQGMPENISEVLKEQEFNDLISYLVSLQ